jgi:hypothetical protein
VASPRRQIGNSHCLCHQRTSVLFSGHSTMDPGMSSCQASTRLIASARLKVGQSPVMPGATTRLVKSSCYREARHLPHVPPTAAPACTQRLLLRGSGAALCLSQSGQLWQHNGITPVYTAAPGLRLRCRSWPESLWAAESRSKRSPTRASSRSRSTSWPRASALPPDETAVDSGRQGRCTAGTAGLQSGKRRGTFAEEGTLERSGSPARSPTPGRRRR